MTNSRAATGPLAQTVLEMLCAGTGFPIGIVALPYRDSLRAVLASGAADGRSWPLPDPLWTALRAYGRSLGDAVLAGSDLAGSDLAGWVLADSLLAASFRARAAVALPMGEPVDPGGGPALILFRDTVASDGETRAAVRLARRAREVLVGLAGTGREVDELHTEVLDLRARVATDPLTGLATRAVLEQRMDTDHGPGTRLGLLVVDLDGLALYNNVFGRAAGDRMISRAADVLRAHTRTGDLVARTGGKEFVVLCADVDRTELGRLRTGLCTAFTTAQLSAAIGAALVWPGGNPRAAWRVADRRMFEAKRASARRARRGWPGTNEVPGWHAGTAVG
jgi:diguanylate cyclase (GGDEF)-like protein